MKIISQKLHAYISLATPHLGTLFSDSQIVSTGKAITYDFRKTIVCLDDMCINIGMWALFQYKKCKALKVSMLEIAYCLILYLLLPLLLNTTTTIIITTTSNNNKLLYFGLSSFIKSCTIRVVDRYVPLVSDISTCRSWCWKMASMGRFGSRCSSSYLKTAC